MLLLGICQPSLVNQKHKMGWFLLRFLDLFRVYCLHIISRNHSNTLLLNDLQKKIVQNKILQQGLLFCLRRLQSTTYAYKDVAKFSKMAFFWQLLKMTEEFLRIEEFTFYNWRYEKVNWSYCEHRFYASSDI